MELEGLLWKQHITGRTNGQNEEESCGKEWKVSPLLWQTLTETVWYTRQRVNEERNAAGDLRFRKAVDSELFKQVQLSNYNLLSRSVWAVMNKSLCIENSLTNFFSLFLSAAICASQLHLYRSGPQPQRCHVEMAAARESPWAHHRFVQSWVHICCATTAYAPQSRGGEMGLWGGVSWGKGWRGTY